MALRPAPATYDRKDQQDVRNEIQRIEKDMQKPPAKILISDITTGRLYYIEVDSGTLKAVLI